MYRPKHYKEHTKEEMIQRQKAYNWENSSLNKLWNFFFGDTHQKKAFEVCDSGTQRLRNGPMADSSFENEVKAGDIWEWAGHKYTDSTMYGTIGAEQEYWVGFQSFQ